MRRFLVLGLLSVIGLVSFADSSDGCGRGRDRRQARRADRQERRWERRHGCSSDQATETPATSCGSCASSSGVTGNEKMPSPVAAIPAKVTGAYREAHAEALRTGSNLYVWVATDPLPEEDGIHCRVDSFPGIKKGCVVGVVRYGRIWRIDDLADDVIAKRAVVCPIQ